ncbi:MAG TPA: cysteine dioxygenase family protein [Thermoanaerobaculia bacterium]|jgi:predicted metal-dependent enzyme (double-stranded beta helix superfamily)|nr:cysteine dioxygenase family protein [Thermoanaerobaculia bacterium]
MENRGAAVRVLQSGLVSSVRRVVHGPGRLDRRVERVGEVLRLFLGQEDLLLPEQRETDPASYRQHLLHAEADGSFSIVALAWLPGQQTSIHDHVCWCAIGLHQGIEREESFEIDGDGSGRVLMPLGTQHFQVGDVATLVPPGDIHRVENPGPGPAISIHVYGTDIRAAGTSIRRRYDLPVLRPASVPPPGDAIPVRVLGVPQGPAHP